MNPERWQRIKEAFSAALDVPTEQRVAWLSSALSDDSSLAREVKDLLAAHERVTDFYDRGALAAIPEVQRQLEVAAEGTRPGACRVHLFDSGSAPDGRPYLVMEYVEGQSITAYIFVVRQEQGRVEAHRPLAEALRGILHNLIEKASPEQSREENLTVRQVLDADRPATD